MQAKALHEAGWLLTNEWDYDRAVAQQQQSLAITRQSQDRGHTVIVLRDLGQAFRLRGDLQRAMQVFEECAALARELKDERIAAWASHCLGMPAHVAGDNTRAMAFWEIELVIDELATHQRLSGRPLRSLKPLGVMHELYGLLIAHYAIRFLMHAAAMQARIDPDRLSFTHAVCVVLDAIPEFQMIGADQFPRRFQRLLRDIAATLLRPRRERINPRVVKRKQSKFDVKRPEHRHWPKVTSTFRKAVALTCETHARYDRVPRLLHPSKSSVWAHLPEPI